MGCMSHGLRRSLALYQQHFLREGVEVLGLALEYRWSLDIVGNGPLSPVLSIPNANACTTTNFFHLHFQSATLFHDQTS